MPRQKETNELWQKAAAFIKSYDSFLVISHVHPDGDAVGSTCAAAHLLERRGKQYVMTNASPIPEKYLFMEKAKEILPWDEAKKASFDAVITVDCADRSRLGDAEAVLEARYPLLNIDHHPTNTRFGNVNVVLPDKAATAELMYDFSQFLQLKWDRAFAEAVFAGVMADTGSFRYANTSPSAMHLAAHLLEYGVVPNRVATHIFDTMTPAKITVIKHALNSLEISDDGRMAWITLTSEQMKGAGAKEEDAGGVINYARNMKGVEVGLLFKQLDENAVKVSIRSDETIDASKIAQQLGGGGHARAAGCTVEGPLPQVQEKVIGLTRRALDLCQTS